MNKESLITSVTMALILTCGLMVSIWLAGVIDAYYIAWVGR